MKATWLKGLALSLLVALVLATGAYATADPILLNGNFSSGMTDWNASPSNHATTVTLPSPPFNTTNLPAGTTTAAVLSGFVIVEQDITNLISGHTYQVSFWAEGGTTSDPFQASVLSDIGGTGNGAQLGSLSSTTLANASGWVQEFFTFTADGTTDDLQIEGTAGSTSNKVAITDVQVAPEPTSLLLMGTGLFGLAFVAFRRSKKAAGLTLSA